LNQAVSKAWDITGHKQIMIATQPASVLSGITGAKRTMRLIMRARCHSSGSAITQSVKLAFIVVPYRGKIVLGSIPPDDSAATRERCGSL
jgi:hypothetical protein